MNKPRMTLLSKMIILAALLSCANARSRASDMCVASELTTAELRGRVTGEHKGEEVHLTASAVVLKRSRRGEWAVVKKLTVGKDGRYNFGKVTPGKYLVEAESYGFVPTGAYVRVTGRSTRAEAGADVVFIVRMATAGCGETRLSKEAKAP